MVAENADAFSRQQLIEQICSINVTVSADWLDSFNRDSLHLYLDRLLLAREPRESRRGWVRPAETPAVVMCEPRDD